MEHFITSIHINEVRHLKNIEIKLNPEKRQHLILTGKNGSGKTSLLLAMKTYLTAINKNQFNNLKRHYENGKSKGTDMEAIWKNLVGEYDTGVYILILRRLIN